MSRIRHSLGKKRNRKLKLESLEARRLLASYDFLRITEVMYDPPQSGGGLSDINLEFVEIYSPITGKTDLRNWWIRGGIDYDFPTSKNPDPIWLNPGETILVVGVDPDRDATAMEAFRDYYSIPESTKIFGPYSGNLNNQGDTVRLMRADAPAWWEPDIIPRVLEDEVVYDNVDPWPLSAGGKGDSLHRRGVYELGQRSESWLATAPSLARFR